ncbi:hypothetical protein SKAU_G00398910 [Synaphobranchus kaupii]|uniref:Retrotransposon gag domain-containing protein n=1 Tax=Synaphobranchus kaupii TaxID=118154 RepID=A0A9Q1E8S0_SYNKA|nr:hypothetical protein SKAU_G00398910 [Synaphobranchus kaupii]
MSVRLNQASDTEGTLPLLEQITLSEFVSQLIQLSDQDRDELQQHSAEECEAEVNRLVQLVQDPSRGTLTVQETVGRLFMLQHRQADLEIKALRAEIKALNRSNERLNSEVQDLRHDLKRAPDALEEHTSKPDESELSQAAATSSLSPRKFPGAPCLQAREEKRRSGLLPPFLPSRRREQEVHFEASPSLHGDRSMSCCRRSVRYDSASPPRRSRDTLRYDSASPPRRSRDASHNKSAFPQRRRRDTSRYESASPPRRKTDIRRRDSTSPYRSGSSVSRRDSASRSRSRADIYCDTYHDRREATPSQPRRNAYDVHARTRTTWSEGESSSSESDYEFHKPRSWGPRHGPRFKHLDSIAKDIEQFDPEKQGHNVEDYLRELERCLSDLPNATRQERVTLIWKTSSRSVRAFIHSQPLIVWESFSQLSRALIEEFSPFANETSATISALQIRHRRSEAPKEFYNRLKHAFFQGRNGPGLTEDRAFKSLFLHNLHSCIRTHVTLMTQIDNPPMHEIRRIAQVAWETVAHTGDRRDEDPKVLATQSSSNVPLEPEDSVVSILKHTAHSSRHDSVKGGWKGGQNKPQGGDIHHLTGGEKGDNGYFSHQEKIAGGSFHS